MNSIFKTMFEPVKIKDPSTLTKNTPLKDLTLYHLHSFAKFRQYLEKNGFVKMEASRQSIIDSVNARQLYHNQLRIALTSYNFGRFETPVERKQLKLEFRKLLTAYYFYNKDNTMGYNEIGKNKLFNKMLEEIYIKYLFANRPKKFNISKYQLIDLKPKVTQDTVVNTVSDDSKPQVVTKDTDGNKTTVQIPQNVTNTQQSTAITNESDQNSGLSLLEMYHTQVTKKYENTFLEMGFNTSTALSKGTLKSIANMCNLHTKNVIYESPVIDYMLYQLENPLNNNREVFYRNTPQNNLSDAFINEFYNGIEEYDVTTPFENYDVAIIHNNDQTIYEKITEYGRGFTGSLLQTPRKDPGICIIMTTLQLGDNIQDYYKSMNPELFQKNNGNNPLLKDTMAVLSYLRGVTNPQVNISNGISFESANTYVLTKDVHLVEDDTSIVNGTYTVHDVNRGDIVEYIPGNTTANAVKGMYQIVDVIPSTITSPKKYIIINNKGKDTKARRTQITKYKFATMANSTKIVKLGDIRIILEPPYAFFNRYLRETNQPHEAVTIDTAPKYELNTELALYHSVINLTSFKKVKDIENSMSLYVARFN